jgi:hypothetical protein
MMVKLIYTRETQFPPTPSKQTGLLTLHLLHLFIYFYFKRCALFLRQRLKSFDQDANLKSIYFIDKSMDLNLNCKPLNQMLKSMPGLKS